MLKELWLLLKACDMFVFTALLGVRCWSNWDSLTKLPELEEKRG